MLYFPKNVCKQKQNTYLVKSIPFYMEDFSPNFSEGKYGKHSKPQGFSHSDKHSSIRFYRSGTDQFHFRKEKC